MTPAETLTLAAYFFVLIILAIYGWHRYYLVYLYMKYRDKGPNAVTALDPTPTVFASAACVTSAIRLACRIRTNNGPENALSIALRFCFTVPLP